ncbi:MAG: hypothetical protein Q8Q31_04160 [Nanoarchaeota archaeon]|nr:hypothetical protein [Nanoarchaeota archaeon]
MTVKRVNLALNKKLETKIWQRSKEVGKLDLQEYIYDLIRKDLSEGQKNPKIKINLSEYYLSRKLKAHFPSFHSDYHGKSNKSPSAPNQIKNSDFPEESIRKKLPSELILEHIEKEVDFQDTLRKLREIGG